MSFIAVGISSAVAVGGTIYAAKSAADSQAEANKTNQEISDATNQLNYEMFLQSRGSGGNALLPMYFDQGTEQQLGKRAFDTWLALQESMGTPANQLRGYQSVVDSLSPSANAGDALVNRLFTGELAQEQEANIAPVMAARGKVAGAQKVGILEGLMERLNALSADRARAGYVGGGTSFQKNVLKSATIPLLQQAATVGAQADLANATDVATIKNNAINTRLNNLDLPLRQAANRIQLNTLPITAAGANANASLAPFDWFKLQPNAFRNEPSPLVKPVTSTGEIVGSGIGSLGTQAGNYFATRDLINRLNGTVPATNPGVNYTYVPGFDPLS